MHPKNDRGLRLVPLWLVLTVIAGACGDVADTMTTMVAPVASTATTQPPATTQPNPTRQIVATAGQVAQRS